MTPRVALTVAESDSGGGAGIQADLKTFAAHRVYGTCALTAVTARHTGALLRTVPLDPDTVAAQVHAVLADLPPQAVKTGMLAAPETVKVVADLAERDLLPCLVVDPVLVSARGDVLMDEGGIQAFRDELLPRAVVATLTLREAALLADVDEAGVTGLEAAAQLAEVLRRRGTHMVVVKCSQLDGGRAADVVAGPGGVVVLDSAHIDTVNDHGAGCSLSAAIAAELADGTAPLEAVERAKSYVHRALSGAARWRLGRGHGPIDHFGWNVGPTLAPGRHGRGRRSRDSAARP